ncbi:tetratricopeptide repeat protein [Thermodesulfovibrio sp. 3462-1]|uniref:Tetratricopeptide repeat protein n=1 Tax=Thermodesulfovibrio obliviosus TaxID=3118332 RepID=A0AAU8H3W4_9BACT
MIFKTKKGIPPGLLTIIRANEKTPKKPIFLIILSLLIVAIGFVGSFIYNHYIESELKSSNKPVQYSTLGPNPSQEKKYTQSSTEPASVQVKSMETENINQNLKTKHTTKPLKQEKVAKQTTQKKQSNKPAEIPFEQFNAETVKAVDYLYRAQDFESRGNYSDAISEYREYLRITGKQDPKILDKIATLYLMIGDLREASHYAQLSLNQAPDNVSIIINYGVIQAKMGNLTKAEECFRKVLSMNPDNKTALYNLALLKEKKKQYEEALKLYERLYQLGDPQATEAIQRIRSYK